MSGTSALRGWYAVGVLLLAYTFSFADRQILSLMVEPIKRDLGLSDTQVSLLHGLAFGIFYTLVGLPIGRLVDNGNRRNIIVAGSAVWSLMTACCGVAGGFWSLFLCRMGVGVGEATLSPSAYSIISDYFHRGQRALALSIYSFGVPLGIGSAFMLGGLIVDLVANSAPIALPFFGLIHPWQIAFIILGLSGLIVPVLLMTLREPARVDRISADSVPIAQVVRFAKSNRLTLVLLMVGMGMLGISSSAILTWMPTLLIRKFEWTAGQIGLVYGLVIIVFGSLGLFIGGWLADRWTQRGMKDAPVRTILYCGLIAAPFCIAAPLMPNAALIITCLIPISIVMTLPQGVASAAFQAITPNEMRGQISAVFLFVINLMGFGFGPTSIALITDYVLRNEARIGTSITLVVVIALPLALLMMAACLRPYRQSLKEAEAWTKMTLKEAKAS